MNSKGRGSLQLINWF